MNKKNKLVSTLTLASVLLGATTLPLNHEVKADSSLQIATGNFVDGQKIASWQNVTTNPTVKNYLPNDGQWLVHNEAKDPQGHSYYLVGNNEYVMAKYTDLLGENSAQEMDATVTISYIPGYNLRIWSEPNSTQATGIVQDQQDYHVYQRRVVHGQTWYELGANQWVNGDYAKIKVEEKREDKNDNQQIEPEAPATNPMQAYAQQVSAKLKQDSLNSHLILQTDERYKSLPYGTGAGTLDENGCAVASLAMVSAFFDNSIKTSPADILNWSGSRYFVDGQGTSWDIFPAFATQFGYQYHDLGNDINNAIPYLKQGIPVVISVGPGQFTQSGHFMVLSYSDDNGIRLLDPNDDPNKNHSLTIYNPAEIQKDMMHIWAFTK
ncbi:MULTISPECIES: C39 family peptidase [Holzapfeliella]